MKIKYFLLIMIGFILYSNILHAQDKINSGNQETETAILKKQLQELKESNEINIARLEELISSLKARLDNAEQQDELKKLLEEANQLSSKEKEEKADISKKFMSGVRSQQGLNPNISLGGDFFAGCSSSDFDFINEAGDFFYGNNGFFMRETELAFVAPLDPFTRGKAFLSVTKEGISIEEAYMELLNLPLNMNLKAGIFYAEFGPLNRYHDHALPQFDRPSVLVNYFSNRGLSGTGIATSFLLPRLLFADASNLDISIINGGNGVSFIDEGKRRILYVGHWKNYYDLSKNSYFEFSLNSVTGKNDMEGKYNSWISSLGLIYKWVPLGREKYRTFEWKTEFFYGVYEMPGQPVKSKGFYSSFENKLNARFWMGGRIGYSELPYDSNQSEWDFTANIDFWQSEFVFFRLQYQYNKRDIFDMKPVPDVKLPSDHSLILQISWAMGPHKHEAY
ncbi:MAG: hypothetical protein JXR31_05350 [Prolixibacteraceae bacterium]|nr:hypothetical protein [Prolixibacteraceae bacterium]MBN2773653.1 hypothetical protein [Prolixibacteraceae bacterium]